MSRLSQAALAKALGVDPAMVTRLKRKGMPVDSVEKAEAWRRENLQVAHRTSKAAPGRKPDKRLDRFNNARTEREELEVQAARLALLERRKVLVHRDTVRAEMARRLATLRESMLQMPVRLQSVLASETDEAKIHDLLQDELHILLEQFAGVA
jgi:transcriptional regulator with XRE-family HTH domain